MLPNVGLSDPERPRSLRNAKIAAVLVVIAALVVAQRFGVFQRFADPTRGAQTLLGMGAWGYLAFIGAYTVLQPFGLPGTVFVMAAPLIWPWPIAFALSMTGTMAASVVGFSFARFVARDWISRVIPPRFKRYDEALARRALPTVFLLRLVFWMPPLLHAFFGVSRVRFWTHFWGSLAGYVAPLLLMSFFGQRVFDVAKHAFAALLPGCSSAMSSSASDRDAGEADGGGGDGGTVDAGACSAAGIPVPAAERISNGNPLLPPKWAFGILWGSYYDQTGSASAQGGNVLTAATRVRAETSGDLMWIDSSWLWHDYGSVAADGQYYVCFQFDPTVFPDPGAMIATLRQEHFHFGVWQWPWMGHGCQYFAGGVTGRDFVMNGASPALATGGWHGDPNPAAFDFTSPAAVSWWTGWNNPLTDWGLDFLKLDTNASQQDTPVTLGGGTLADPTKSYEHERNLAAAEATKLYAAANDPAAHMNGARAFILEKAGSPANDQIAAQWTDDRAASFAGMVNEMQAASTKNTAATSAYWCGDTGGYAGTPSDELYMRWLEYTTFTPLQEFFGAKQGGAGARFPWLFGVQSQQVQKQYADLRYRLLPFRYSSALKAYEEKPVAYPVSWIGSTQLLVGSGDSQLLVQPVTVAGATTASVVLPAGTAWVHYWTGTSYPEGTVVTVAAPIDQEPIFVKAGSIIPMGPTMGWVDEVPADPLTLDVYPAGATGYTLYEDDGISEGYLGGAYATTRFTSDDTSGHEVVTIGPQAVAKYGYSGRLCERTYVMEIHGQKTGPAMVTRDGSPMTMSTAAGFGGATTGWYFDGAGTVWVKLRLAAAQGAKVAL